MAPALPHPKPKAPFAQLETSFCSGERRGDAPESWASQLLPAAFIPLNFCLSSPSSVPELERGQNHVSGEKAPSWLLCRPHPCHRVAVSPFYIIGSLAAGGGSGASREQRELRGTSGAQGGGSRYF